MGQHSCEYDHQIDVDNLANCLRICKTFLGFNNFGLKPKVFALTKTFEGTRDCVGKQMWCQMCRILKSVVEVKLSNQLCL